MNRSIQIVPMTRSMLLAAKRNRTHSVDNNTEDDAYSRSNISEHYRSSMVRASRHPSSKRKSTRSFQ